MALDFIAIDQAGRSIETVLIGVEPHWRLFGNLPPSEWPMLSRLAEYYEDADFSFEELGGLIAEIRLLMSGKGLVSDGELLRRLMELSELAREKCGCISVQAD